jgi:LmbE family N-acetylglucosaminyl deacetylase
MKTLFLSPHFDDLFLSSFARLTQAGSLGFIVYPFATPQDENSLRWLHEELPNVREVGCEWLFLNVDNAEQADTVAKRAFIAEILAKRLSEVICAERPDEIIAPLGIGLHPEHLVCALGTLLALRNVGERSLRVVFYSDIPYCIALPLLRGGPLQLIPQSKLQAQIVQVDANKKLAACRRYVSQFEDDGTFEEMIAQASPDAVSMRYPLASGESSYECYWTPKGDTLSAGIEDLIAVIDTLPPQDIELLERELLPTPSDYTPFFSPDYADCQRRWSEAIQNWAKREIAP